MQPCWEENMFMIIHRVAIKNPNCQHSDEKSPGVFLLGFDFIEARTSNYTKRSRKLELI